MPLTDRFKIAAFLTLVLTFCGNTGACSGGSSAPSTSGNLNGSSPLSSSTGLPGNASTEGSAVTTAATPGQQPTEWGTVGENPLLLLVHVASPNGTVDLSTEVQDKASELKYVDDSHCKTKQGDLSPQIFPGEKPQIYNFISSSPVKTPLNYPTNACGSSTAICPLSEQGKGFIEIFATYNDQGLIYQSDTVKIDCTTPHPSPVILILKASFSRTDSDIIPTSNSTLSPPTEAPLPQK